MQVCYGLGDVGVALATSAIGSYLMFFYTDLAGLDIATAGLVLGAGRVWDALNDPAIGYLSDRTRSRFGRRRPWFAAAALPLGLSVFALFAPPRAFTGLELALWMLVTYLTADVFFTLFLTPYYALGAELSEDPDERTRIVAIRTFFWYAGAIAGSAMPFLAPLAAGADLRVGYGRVALAFGAIATFAIAAAFFGTREPPAPPARAATLGDFVRGVRESLRNRPFRILLATFVTMSVGSGLNGAVAIYAFVYWLGYTGAEAGQIVPTYLAAAALALPFWSRISTRHGKDRALRAVCLYEAVILSSIWFLTPARPLVLAFLVLAGFGLAGFLVAGSLLADVLDHDELESGEPRGGAFFGFWSFALKLAAGAGPPVVGFVLSTLGYVPNQVQSPAVILAMRALYGPIPALFFVAAAIVFWRFPLSREAHASIQRALRERRAADSRG